VDDCKVRLRGAAIQDEGRSSNSDAGGLQSDAAVLNHEPAESKYDDEYNRALPFNAAI